MAQERLPPCLGRYQVLEQIGAGGMGVVVRALDPKLGRNVAIKLLTTYLGTEPEFAERFRREATALARLTHPNVVRVFDSGEQDGRPFYVMELLAGRRLDERTEDFSALRAQARDFDATAFLEIFIPLADALCAVHVEGVLHRDIKPANVMIGVPERGVVLTDFGLAAIEGTPGLTLEGEILGTSRYIAPEQLTGSKATAVSDIFGLGLCMYEYATERVPFADIPVHLLLPARVHAELVPVARLSKSVPGAIAAVIDRAVKNSPSARFTTAQELHRALVRIRREGLDRPNQGTAVIQLSSVRSATAPLTPAAAGRQLRGWALAGLACSAAALGWRWQAPLPWSTPPGTGASVAQTAAAARPQAPANLPRQEPRTNDIAGQPIDLCGPSQGPHCGYAGPALAHTSGRQMAVWVGPGGRVFASTSADGGRSWTRPALDGKLQARANMAVALAGIDGRFFLLYSVGAGPVGEDTHSPILAAWTPAEATAWSSPSLLGVVRDHSAVSLASARMADGRARLLAVWKSPGAGPDPDPSFTTAWGDAGTGAWSRAESHPMEGSAFDDPVALVTPSEGIVAGRLRRLIFGDLIASRSSGPGTRWSPPSSGRIPSAAIDRKQPTGATDGELAYLVFRKPAKADAVSQALIISRDGFRTVEHERVLPAPPLGSNKSCRLVARGSRLWVVWEGTSPTPEYWASSSDGGSHWTTPKPFAEFTCWHPAPALDLDDTGRAWVCWADTEMRVRALALP